MNPIKIAIFFLFALFFSLSANASVFSINPGETKTVTISMVGAITASRVAVSGRNIAARITQKSPGKVRVRLTANENARAGLRDINVTLAAGVNKSMLAVFHLKNTNFEVTGDRTAGKFQKFRIHFPAAYGRLVINPSRACVFSEDGTPRGVERSVPRLRQNGNHREIWVSTRINEDRAECSFHLTQHYMKQRSETRPFAVRFRQDRTVPDHLDAPRLITRDNTIEETVNRSGNSPELRWRNVSGANGYIVSYRTGNNRFREARLVRGRIQNLPVGTYEWLVYAKYDTGNDSVLPDVVSDPSHPREFTIRQVR